MAERLVDGASSCRSSVVGEEETEEEGYHSSDSYYWQVMEEIWKSE